MQFQSKFGAYQVLVRPEVKKYSADGLVVIDTIPRLSAEFGRWGDEYSYQNPMTGAMDKGADMRGFFFDTRVAQEELGWSDEERELVETVLKRQCERTPEHVWLYQEARVPAPWPTYDDTHHNQVSVLAEQLGLVESALAYEKQNKARAGVVEKLEALLVKDQIEEELTAA